ncbi:MAG: hypothetical protein NVSMB9_09710 [Isosphaeraceae bacterium]
MKPRIVWPDHELLTVALLVNAVVPMSSFLDLPGTARLVESCTVVFGLIIFAGVTFATRFRRSRRPDVDFDSNVAGVIRGGLAENFSLMPGFCGLLFPAVTFYGLSAVLGSRRSTNASS